MKAIQTKILPATDHLPTRIKALAEGVKSRVWSVSDLEDYLRNAGKSQRIEAVHAEAARRLAKRYGWGKDRLVSGGLPDGSWAHCFVQCDAQVTFSNYITADDNRDPGDRAKLIVSRIADDLYNDALEYAENL